MVRFVFNFNLEFPEGSRKRVASAVDDKAGACT